MVEVHLCPAQIPDCPDLPSDDAVNLVVDLLDSHPDAEVTDVPSDPAATPTGNDDATTAPSSLTVAFRLDRTTSPDQLLRDLVSLPVVSSVSIGSAEQPPSAFAELDDVPTGPRRELGHLEVPVHGDNEPVVFEIWEAKGRICHGAESLFSHCGNLTVTEGAVAGGTSSGNDPNCVTAITGIGVDHVRMGFADGTLLQVATTQLHPALTLLDLHAACWQDGPANVITEIIAPDGTVIDRNPPGVPLPSPNR